MGELDDEVSDSEFWAAMKAEKQERGRVNRELAERDFARAVALARRSGLLLVRKSDTHYQLEPAPKGQGWLLNLYPGNQRIYSDKNRPKAPYLGWAEKGLNRDWALEDLVLLVHERLSRRRAHE